MNIIDIRISSERLVLIDEKQTLPVHKGGNLHNMI